MSKHKIIQRPNPSALAVIIEEFCQDDEDLFVRDNLVSLA